MCLHMLRTGCNATYDHQHNITMAVKCKVLDWPTAKPLSAHSWVQRMLVANCVTACKPSWRWPSAMGCKMRNHNVC
jgi:hypothetical protein